jgi:hypothetical protein
LVLGDGIVQRVSLGRKRLLHAVFVSRADALRSAPGRFGGLTALSKGRDFGATAGQGELDEIAPFRFPATLRAIFALLKNCVGVFVLLALIGAAFILRLWINKHYWRPFCRCCVEEGQ